MQSTNNDDESAFRLDSFVISTNITWYKLLTAFTCICTTFIYAILIWFLVCKDDRLRIPDAEKKKKAYERELKIIKKELDRIQRINELKKRFKYLITGKAGNQYQQQQQNYNQHNNKQNYLDYDSNETEKCTSSSHSLISIASSTQTIINLK
jgi:hypothetical protein